jgi:hypothetical protein
VPPRVQLAEHLAQEGRVGVPAGEVRAAPQQQGLPQRPLELAMALFDVAVLVGLTRVDRLPLQVVVPQQRLVAGLQRVPLLAGRHRRRQAVRAVELGHAAQLPQGILQPLAEALQALGEADRPRLPVRVGQHKVIHQMGEGGTGDGHAQLGAVGEVTGA